jgi:hypothetical protein
MVNGHGVGCRRWYQSELHSMRTGTVGDYIIPVQSILTPSIHTMERQRRGLVNWTCGVACCCGRFHWMLPFQSPDNNVQDHRAPDSPANGRIGIRDGHSRQPRPRHLWRSIPCLGPNSDVRLGSIAKWYEARLSYHTNANLCRDFPDRSSS